tara:strand:+ start:4519 stop:4755 length:237 start_codon:yes stop_codon:yes gene_type:complete
MLPPQKVEIVNVERFPCAVDGKDDGQTHHRFCRSHDNDEKNENDAGHGIQGPSKADEGKIDGIQHQFNAHENDDHVTS